MWRNLKVKARAALPVSALAIWAVFANSPAQAIAIVTDIDAGSFSQGSFGPEADQTQWLSAVIPLTAIPAQLDITFADMKHLELFEDDGPAADTSQVFELTHFFILGTGSNNPPEQRASFFELYLSDENGDPIPGTTGSGFGLDANPGDLNQGMTLESLGGTSLVGPASSLVFHDFHFDIGDPILIGGPGPGPPTLVGTPISGIQIGIIADRVVPGTWIPEPASLALFGAGLAGLGWMRRRRRRRPPT